MTTLPPWDPDDSKRLDKQIRDLRRLEKQERSQRAPAPISAKEARRMAKQLKKGDS